MVTQRRTPLRFTPLLWLLVTVLSVGSLLNACAPQAPAQPAAPAKPTEAPKPTEPAKPAEAAKPAAPAAATAPVAAKPAEPANPTEAPKPAEAPKPTAAPSAAAPSGSLTIAVAEEPPTLSMWEGTSAYAQPILRNVAEALVNRDPKSSDLVGELATRWEQTNPTTWRFTLRPNIKFHDGSAFNAESAAFSLNHTWSKENNFKMRSRVGPEMTFKPVDELTLDVETESPDPILPSRLYFSPIGSMKQLKETPDLYPVKPIGTGPYKLVDWTKGQFIKLTANPDWWGNSASDAWGATAIKDVMLVFRPEGAVRTGMMKTGEADFARGLTNAQCKEAPACVSSPTLETVFLRLDITNPAMGDLRIRQAIALGVDKSSLMNAIMGGGELSAQMAGSRAVGFNKDLAPYPYDPNKAKQLVVEAKAAGVPVDVPLTVYTRRGFLVGIEEAGEAISDMLKQSGLNVQSKLLETASYQALINVATKPIPPERGMIAVHSNGNELLDYSQSVSGYLTCTSLNSTFCDQTLDDMHKKALALSGAERDKAYQELAKYIYDRYYTVPIGHPNFYYGLSAKLDWTPRLDGFVLFKEMKLKS